MFKSSINLAKISFALLAFLFAVIMETQAATIHVPGDYPIIQQAINAAQNGDMVLVAPGTYDTRISFEGKAITVTSEAGPQHTILSGGSSVVRFISGETNSSVISGFTIQNAYRLFGRLEGGIYIENSSPTIIGNIIKNNIAIHGGGAITIAGNAFPGSFTIIEGNLITNNRSDSSQVGRGAGGISVTFGASAKIIDNVITDNICEFVGGGLSLYQAGNVVILNNKILRNSGYSGAGININNCTSALVVQNLIADNRSDSYFAAGIYVSNQHPDTQVTILNNTIANNFSFYSGILTLNLGQHYTITNNIVVATNPYQRGIHIARVSPMAMPDAIRANNVFSPQGSAYGGAYPDQTGRFGNLSVDPQFVNAANGDYHLQQGSPSIDAGYNLAANLPITDLDGNIRIFDGDNNGLAIVDMGAFEFGSSPFDLCIQDESSKDILLFNTTTGAYQLTRCRDGFTIGGTGTLSKRGCTISFQDSRSDRRIMANIDTCSNRATASVQIFAQGSSFTLTDRNTTNNTCSCPNSQ
jgi:hypothetical protein